MSETAPARGIDPLPGEWLRVSPRYVIVHVSAELVRTIVLTAIFATPWYFSGVLWLVSLPIVVAVIGLIFVAFTPRRVRSIGYRLRDDDLVFRRGILFQRLVAVPYGRMQLVDITRGPLDRALGLAQLKLVTAASSSNVAIPGLPFAVSEALRDSLVNLAESRRVGL